jgi:P27 family predicted phage terminase small subunit
MKGPPPKPHFLKVLEGNRDRRRPNPAAPRPIGDLAEPPADLPEAARPFWTQAINDAPRGLLKRSDERALFVWSVAAWLHSVAANELAQAGTVTATGNRKGAIKKHPTVSILGGQASVMQRAGDQLGFSPVARSRVRLEPSRDGDVNPFEEFR